jgi:protein SCO1/2
MADSPGPARASAAQRLRWALLAAVLAGTALLAGRVWLGRDGGAARSGVLRGGAARAPGALPDLGAVPAFALVERSERPLVLDDLAGCVWITDFIFTRCAGICPVMTSSMSRLQENLADVPSIRLVSISVDPEWDTPQVLREYAQGVAADSARWLFATGGKAEIYALAQRGFRLGVGEADGSAAGTDGASASAAAGDEILHSSRFVLVDASGRIRGYYDGEDLEAVALLESHARALAREAAAR